MIRFIEFVPWWSAHQTPGVILLQEVHTNQLQTAQNIVNFYQNKEDKEEVKEYHNAQKYIGENLVNELVW